MAEKAEKTRKITLEVRERDYQTILKACRVYGHLADRLMEVGTRDEAGEEGVPSAILVDFNGQHVPVNPLAGVCHAYMQLMSGALFMATPTPSADGIIEAIAELKNRK